MSVQPSHANSLPRIKINPKSAPQTHAGSKFPPRSGHKNNSAQLANSPHKATPSLSAVPMTGGKAGGRKSSHMNGTGGGRGKAKAGSIDTGRRVNGDPAATARPQVDEEGDVVVLNPLMTQVRGLVM